MQKPVFSISKQKNYLILFDYRIHIQDYSDITVKSLLYCYMCKNYWYTKEGIPL